MKPKVQHYSTPASLRVTNGHSGSIPRETAQRAGLLRGDQVGERLWMYAWYHFADVKNDKSFLEPWDLSMGRTALDVCVVSFRRRQKQQAVFVEIWFHPARPTPGVSEYQADHLGTFTAKYHLHKPVYVESFASMPDTIDRETHHQPRF